MISSFGCNDGTGISAVIGGNWHSPSMHSSDAVMPLVTPSPQDAAHELNVDGFTLISNGVAPTSTPFRKTPTVVLRLSKPPPSGAGSVGSNVACTVKTAVTT